MNHERNRLFSLKERKAAARRKGLLLAALPALICAAGIGWLYGTFQKAYQNAAYSQISGFCQVLLEREPEAESEVFAALKEYQNRGRIGGSGKSGWLEAYGYGASDFAKEGMDGFGWMAAAVAVCILAAFFLVLCTGARRTRLRVAELTRGLEQVNLGKAGAILPGREDAFSILQDEMEKTVTNLRTARDGAVCAKERFAENLANIAHQMKTPVAAAGLSLQLLEQKVPEECREQIGTAKRQLGRLNRLEEALLALSQIDAGTLRLENEPVDIYTVLTLAAENLEGLPEAEGIRVEIPEKESVLIQGDMEWFMEALMNLMKNCMEHSPRAGTIHCDYGSNPLYAWICIRDEGEGFAPEDLPRLFQRFYRGRNAAGEGIGLGLALAREIVELHGGSVAARSLPEGGACFELHIYHK